MRKGKQNKNFIWILKAMMAVCICVSAVFLVKKFTVEAVIDETKAVPYSTYAASHRIEDSVLFIGTYLIHSQALTDELYEKAMESASQSGQSKVYYKSELASGTWYDITDASGIDDISEKGVIVKESELADLWVTSYTGADGITKDVLNDSAISIFDTPNPYNLYELPELEAIRLQYDNSFSESSTGVERYYYDKLKEFFELEIIEEERRNEYDEKLSGLQECYTEFCSQKKDDLAETVHKLMDKLDAARRVEVFSKLCQIENNEIDKLQRSFSISGYAEVKSDYGKDFVENMNVSDAIGTALESCHESYISYSGKILTEGDTALSKKEYELSTQIIDNADSGYNAAQEARIIELCRLYHIKESVVADIEGEQALLDEILSDAETAYRKLLQEGAGIQYREAVASGAGLAVREKLLEEQQAEADAAGTELQLLIKAKTERMGSEEAADFLYQKIDEISSWSDNIASDDYMKNAKNSLDSQLLGLKEMAADIAGGNEEMKSNIERLEKEKKELLTLKQEAIDKNDLSSAKKYDAMIELLDQEIAKASEELNNILKNPSASAADKAKAEIQSGTSTALNNINKMKNSALAALASGSTDIGNFLDALAAMGAEDALNELKDKVDESLTGKAGEQSGNINGSQTGKTDGSQDGKTDGSQTGKTDGSQDGKTDGSQTGNTDGKVDENQDVSLSGNLAADSNLKALKAAIEEAIENSRESSMHDIYGDGQVYDGTEELLNAIEDFFGADIDSLSEENQAIAVYAMNQAGQNGNTAAAELGKTCAEQFGKKGNAFFYPKYGNGLEPYVSIKAVGNCTGYRYIYNETLSEISLTAGTKKYAFTINSNKMIISKADGTASGLEEEYKLLGRNVALNSIPYLAAADAKEIFGCSAEDVYGSEYGVCISGIQIEKAEEFLEQIQ